MRLHVGGEQDQEGDQQGVDTGGLGDGAAQDHVGTQSVMPPFIPFDKKGAFPWNNLKALLA